MNAMKKKMPDKLFGWTGVLGSFYASPRKPEEVNSEEYIRKDTLMEWAKETYLNENASAIRKVCYKQLIEKIESL